MARRNIELLEGDFGAMLIDAVIATVLINDEISELELRKLREVLLLIWPEITLHWILTNISPRDSLKKYIRIICSIFIESFLQKGQAGKTIIEYFKEASEDIYSSPADCEHHSDMLSALREFEETL